MSLVPLVTDSTKKTLVITYADATDLIAGRAFNSIISDRLPRSTVIRVDDRTTEAEYAALGARADSADLVLVSAYVSPREFAGTVGAQGGFTQFVEKFALSGKPIIVISLGARISSAPFLRCRHTCSRGEARRSVSALLHSRFWVIVRSTGACQFRCLRLCRLGPVFIEHRPGCPVHEASPFSSFRPHHRFLRASSAPGPSRRRARTDPVRAATDGSQQFGLDTSLPAALDKIVKTALDDAVAPGVAIAVGRNGHIAYMKGYGTIDWNRPGSPAVDTNTLYDLASLTKVIATTTAAMILEENGQLDLDARLVVPPEFKDGKSDKR